MTSLNEFLSVGSYQGYAYSYPHKMSYRPLTPEVPLRPLWASEDRSALFLYVHVPFCEMRCGFCNLFTIANPRDDLEQRYLDALNDDFAAAADWLGEAQFARVAIGGGTPTYLTEGAIARLLQQIRGLTKRVLPTSVEVSPDTATMEKLRMLSDAVSRISIGVQSFSDTETRAAGRPQRSAAVYAALERIRAEGFRTLNIDLIYGIPGQSLDSWRHSLREALRFVPEELYLYPLYVRPLTGAHRRHIEPQSNRLALYRAAREFLLSQGYEQLSMRMFRRRDAGESLGPVYCCQDDGMVGLGAGARSYTRELHYSSEYAVGRKGIRGILESYIQKSSRAVADYGTWLGVEEQRRRYVIKSLLRTEGLSLPAYRARFGADVWTDLPALHELVEAGVGELRGDVLALNDRGIEQSDAVGPWLTSSAVHERMCEFELQ